MIGLIMFPGQERTPRRDISLSLGSHIGRDTELPKALLPCSLVGVFLLEDLEICTCLHIQPTHTYTRGHIHMSADVFRFARVHTYVYIDTCVQTHLGCPQTHSHICSQSHTHTVAGTHVHTLHSWHTHVSTDASSSCLLPVWE